METPSNDRILEVASLDIPAEAAAGALTVFRRCIEGGFTEQQAMLVALANYSCMAPEKQRLRPV